MNLLRKLLKNRWSILSLIRFPIRLIANYYGSFQELRNLIAQLDGESSDRNTFFHTLASKDLVDDRLNYVDIGARGGLLEFLRPFEQILRPVFFEPDADEFIQMQEQYKGKQVEIINAAISDCSGTKTLYLTRKRGGSSLLQPSGHMIGLMAFDSEGIKRFDIEKTMAVDTKKLCEVLKFPETKIDVLKIDTQGSEYEILTGLGDHRPFLICAECSTTEIYKNQRSIFAVGSLLESLGYFPIHLMEGHLIPKTAAKRRSSTQLYGDVIFVPDNSPAGRAIIERDVEKWFVALCMHGFMDFALWQIEELKIPRPPLVTQTEDLLRSQ